MALWEKSEDPSWRQKVATLADHSLQTAERYYEFSDKSKASVEVAKVLSSIKEDTIATASGSNEPHSSLERQVLIIELGEEAQIQVTSCEEDGGVKVGAEYFAHKPSMYCSYSDDMESYADLKSNAALEVDEMPPPPPLLSGRKCKVIVRRLKDSEISDSNS